MKNLLEFATTTFTDARPETPDYHQRQRCSRCSFQMANTRLYVVTPLINVQINNAIGEIARLPSKFFATSAPPRDSAALAFRVPALLLDGGAQAMTADGICVV